MARDIFSKLKKYAGSEISQDENYTTVGTSIFSFENYVARQIEQNETIVQCCRLCEFRLSVATSRWS